MSSYLTQKGFWNFSPLTSAQKIWEISPTFSLFKIFWETSAHITLKLRKEITSASAHITIIIINMLSTVQTEVYVGYNVPALFMILVWCLNIVVP